MKVAAPGCAGRVFGCAAAIFVATTFSKASLVTSVSAAISSSSGLWRSYIPLWVFSTLACQYCRNHGTALARCFDLLEILQTAN